MKQIFFFSIIVACFSLFSHTIIFRNLKVIKGIVYKQDSKYIYLHKDSKKVRARKDTVARVLVQDITDKKVLKKILKKVKSTYPNYKLPDKKEPPTVDIADIEVENVDYLLAEIEEEERLKAEQEKRRTEEDRLKTIRFQRKEAFIKALTFPGRGHFVFEKKKQGYIYAGTFTFFLIGTLYQYNKQTRNIKSMIKRLVMVLQFLIYTTQLF